ncbi:hypothetical protein MKX01_004678 [Papaver californicum]|nr:hypothetical protein MKX01_004678 [Papaver californicum]
MLLTHFSLLLWILLFFTSLFLGYELEITTDEGGYGLEGLISSRERVLDGFFLFKSTQTLLFFGQIILFPIEKEGLMAENIQKLQKVKKIDEVQKAAAGRGVGGVQILRIAFKEFIFSLSFTGDKGLQGVLILNAASKPTIAETLVCRRNC